MSELDYYQGDNGKVSYKTICFPFLISHFYLHKSSNHTFINSHHREYQERMRKEYKYKITTMRSRIAVLECYYGGSSEQVLRWLIRSGRGKNTRGGDEGAGGRLAEVERFKAVKELSRLRRR
jgi:hypothetical protein